MSKIYQFACNGSVKAARLYFAMTGVALTQKQ